MRVLMLVLCLLGNGCYGLPAAAKDAGEDIWPRIVSGMKLDGQARPEVQHWIRHYAAHPAALNRMLDRAAPFLWFIVEAAEVRELPMELALLPAVESGFDAHAVSKSAALGLWQFIPATGRAYGLRESASYDARRDPVASTRAALSLLQALHREHGDWLLALAAYNGGGVHLRTAMRSGGSRNFWELPLRPETRDYVPRLLALAAIVRRPAAYGVKLPTMTEQWLPELLATDEALRRGLSVSAALTAAQVDPQLLRRYNPGLKHLRLDVGSPTLLLPAVDALVVRAELAEAALRDHKPRPARSKKTKSPAAQLIPVSAQAATKPDPLGLRWRSSPSPATPVVGGSEPLDEKSTLHRVHRVEPPIADSRQHRVPVETLRRISGIREKETERERQTLRVLASP